MNLGEIRKATDTILLVVIIGRSALLVSFCSRTSFSAAFVFMSHLIGVQDLKKFTGELILSYFVLLCLTRIEVGRKVT